MKGNFSYHNPTRIHFGRDSLEALTGELGRFGPHVMLVYGGGSIKKNGIYEKIVGLLRAAGKEIYEDGGVMPNPTVEKLADGCRIVRDRRIDLILAVGGGSVCDYAKAVSVSAYCAEDPWEKYFIRFEEPTCDIVPVGCVLTMAGTGSEMNGGAVITNHSQKLKIGHVFGPDAFPKFSILNPEFTFTVPKYQMVAGIFDIMSHLLEQYFSGDDDSTSDYLAEGLMRSLIHSSRITLKNPKDYEARSNIMWTATWALNTLTAQGKATDWEAHMLAQAVAAHTDATHGMTLAAISLPYYRYIMPFGLEKFARFATNVWGVESSGKTTVEVAEKGLTELEKWMKELGLVMKISELGLEENMLEAVASSTLVMRGGYKILSREDIIDILKASL